MGLHLCFDSGDDSVVVCSDILRFVGIVTVLGNEVLSRTITGLQIFRRIMPCVGPTADPIEKLAEIVCFETERVGCVHNGLIHLARFVCSRKLKAKKRRLRFDPVIRQRAVMAKATSVKWTREHFLIALNLYCKLPFGKLHKGNPLIKEVAAKMGRTASSLAMKLSNFASLDPVLTARGIKGLDGATKQDRIMWAEFRSQIGTQAPESEELLHNLFTADETEEVDFLQRDRVRLEPSSRVAPTGPTEKLSMVKLRRGQQFFRQSILNAYGVRCCITGISVPRLLVASHIRPWSAFPDDRLNPRNGLCLSSLHDAAFDSGLITLDENLRVVLSSRLKAYFPQPALEQNFVAYEGRPIRKPEMLTEPAPEFLAHHRTTIFKV